MIKTSKKSAHKLGSELALVMHSQTTIEAAMAMSAVRTLIMSHFDHEVQCAFNDGINLTLDILESSGKTL